MVKKPKAKEAGAQALGQRPVGTQIAPGRITETGIIFDDSIKITLEEYTAAGGQLAQTLVSGSWAIGDYINYGKKHFPDAYEKAAATWGLDYGYLRNCASIAAKYAIEKRRPSLSQEHHRIVAALPEPKREALLDRAEKDKLSSAALRKLTPTGEQKAKSVSAKNNEALAHAEALIVALSDAKPCMLVEGMGDKWFGKAGFLFRIAQACQDVEAEHAEAEQAKAEAAIAKANEAAATAKGK